MADKRVADHAYQMCRGSYYTNLHDYMDCALSAHLANFQLQLQEGRTNDFGQHFWFIVEHSVADFTSAARRVDAEDFMGRVTKLVKKATIA